MKFSDEGICRNLINKGWNYGAFAMTFTFDKLPAIAVSFMGLSLNMPIGAVMDKVKKVWDCLEVSQSCEDRRNLWAPELRNFQSFILQYPTASIWVEGG